MIRAVALSRLRLCLAVLPVLMLLAGPWTQISAVEAMAIVICSDGAMKTVQVDANADRGSGQECRDCPACIMPISTVRMQNSDSTRPTDWIAVFHPLAIDTGFLSRRAPGPLSRGPPIQLPRYCA